MSETRNNAIARTKGTTIRIIKTRVSVGIRALLLVPFLYFAATITCPRQNNKAAEKCTKDADCETGNCVALKDKGEENEMICLYCTQVNHDSLHSDVQRKCKPLDDIGRYFDLKSELQRAANGSDEFSLPWLVSIRDLGSDCLTARVARERSCWNDRIDSGDRQQIDDLKEAVNAAEYLIKESVRNGRAYNLDRENFKKLIEAEESTCKDLDRNFAWLKGFKDDERVDCPKLLSAINEARSCKEVRNSIVKLFQDHASSQRVESLAEAGTAESEATRILDSKGANHQCK
jgi:hypothetical protein